MKDIVGFEGRYAVTEDGKVWSYKSGRYIKAFLHRKGYPIYYLSCGSRGQRKIMFGHRLVALTYLANPKNLKEVNHRDCNKQNNHISNLEWCSRLENVQHAYKHNLVPIHRHEKHRNAKITMYTAQEVRRRYKEGGVYQRDLAREFGVSQRTIWNVIHHLNWVS
jgi:hypothetical protein